MSKFIEYLKLVPKGFVNAKQIVEAVVNNAKIEFGTISEKDLEIITARRIICATCPYMSKNATVSGVYTSDRDDDHCTICLCPIITKTASLSSNCGLEQFNEENPEFKIPLKWIAVKS